MHAAIGHQSRDMQAVGIMQQFLPYGVFSQRPVVEGIGDARQVLFQHTPGTQGQMSHLGVAELAVRQPDRPAGSLQNRVRIGRKIVIEVRGACQCPGIVRTTGVQAETVENDQQNGLWLQVTVLFSLAGIRV